ncbi:MAG TPA: serine/threonine-protein kinase, partial [Kofleriaceae bacterium]|nr:serine/threonine-protein kinase [Kofleriaceae bacterium]
DGGMAEVLLARTKGIEGFERHVVIKRIRSEQAHDQRYVTMFLDEARLAATLHHVNVVQVNDIGQEDGEYFFAMEYVHGQDLAHVLHRAPHHKLPLEHALHIAIGVCAGLHCAHIARDATGRPLDIVHRDVSPSNVLVSYQGAVKLVDFGVAQAATLVSETREGVIKGKYGYLSPEQCLGDPLDRRSDVFAVGILLWEMTVGRRLYAGKGELAQLQRIVYVDAPPPSRFDPQYPPALERIVVRALARDPRQRHHSAEQLQLELEQFAVDHRLAISAVSLASEMKALFRDQVEAWSAAERAGQSLGDHLASASAAVPLAPGIELDDLDDDETRGDDMDAETAAAVEQARRAAARAFERETRLDLPGAGEAGAAPPPPAMVAHPPDRSTAAAPAALPAPVLPHELARELRRSQDVVKIRPSRSVPGGLVVILLLAIAVAWVLLVQRPG